jgi:hypothetical protein
VKRAAIGSEVWQQARAILDDLDATIVRAKLGGLPWAVRVKPPSVRMTGKQSVPPIQQFQIRAETGTVVSISGLRLLSSRSNHGFQARGYIYPSGYAVGQLS